MKISATLMMFALLALPACDGGDKTTTSDDATTGGSATDASATDTPTTDTPTTEGATTAPGELSFAADVWDEILLPICTCHQSATGSGGLGMGMDAATAYAAMVGVKATGAPMLDRVLAGDSTKSYIINKLEGTQLDVGGAGAQMPLAGTITPDQIQTIKDWIDAGAKP
jgi:hypothetical protein